MCGIAGVVGLKEKGRAFEVISRMSESLAHRGPDAAGDFVDDGAALGHRRLSIIDLSQAANQPMSDPSGRYTIIYNGEVYNYRDVRRAVPEYPYSTESDTEAVLAAYIHRGADCLSMLDGMFAFAIWDSHANSLFVARDRFGVKPLYYAQTADGVFVFASEIRAILNSGLIERSIDKRALFDYVMYHSAYSPRTIVEGVRHLPAGSCGIAAGTDISIKRYWRIEDMVQGVLTDDERTVKKNVRDLLLSSVEKRMISDVRLGAFLSGGIDSSAVVGLMSEVSEQPVDTFSVTFEEAEFDESAYSELISKRFNTRHTAVRLSAGDFLSELPAALEKMDSPSGDGLNTYVVSKATRESGLKVALSGVGGDELFAGYPTFRFWTRIRSGWTWKLPPAVRSAVSSVVARSNRSRHQRVAELLNVASLDLDAVYPLFRQVLSKKAVAALCGGNGHPTAIQADLRQRASDVAEFPLLSQVSIGELLGYTHNVLLKDTDQFSMASALEVREPYFDHHLVEYVLRIPDQLKSPRYPKSLLVESLAPMLPDEIVHRRKMGFVLPWESWMRKELRDFCDSRISGLREREILDDKHLAGLWKSFCSGSGGVLWSHVWHLVVLEDWLQTNDF